jgi:hypothetical protein
MKKVNEIIAHKNTKFIVSDDGRHLELRMKNGEFISSICCRKCLPKLKRAIKIFEEKDLECEKK